MQIFLVLAGIVEFGFGVLVFAAGPAITQQIAGTILFCSGVITLALAEFVHIGQLIARAAETQATQNPLQTSAPAAPQAYSKAKVCSFCGHNNPSTAEVCRCGRPLAA